MEDKKNKGQTKGLIKLSYLHYLQHLNVHVSQQEIASPKVNVILVTNFLSPGQVASAHS